MKNKEYTNKELSHLLRSLAAANLLKNESRFVVIAYEKAADLIEHLSREIHDIWQEGKLANVEGLGPSIRSHLEELFSKGESKRFEQILKGIPPTVFLLMNIPGIGPKKAFKLVQSFEIVNVDTAIEDLKKVAHDGKIASLPSFGEKSQKDILESINLFEQTTKERIRMPLMDAYTLAMRIENYLKQLPEVKDAVALGSLRRGVTTIGDIDIAVIADDKDSEKIVQHFIKYEGIVDVDNTGDKKASIIVTPNVRVDLRVQDKKTFGSMLQYFTGSKAHNIKLREYAIKKGLSLSEYGIKKGKGGKENIDITPFKTEKEFYNYLGLEYIPPEIREGTNEIDLSLKKKLPDLIELKDIKGDLHTHSSYDLRPSHDLGANTFEEMAQKAKDLGYEYIGFSEHNPNIGNNSEEDIINIMKKRKAYIDELFKKKQAPVKYFIGLEVDILPDGNLALPTKAIEYVDYLIISVHSSFRLGIEEMTKRVLKAMSFPKVKIVGHPTGRFINQRQGFELDWNKIFQEARDKNIAMEINAGWPRLDLPDLLVRQALEYGVQFTIDTDAHAVEGMNGMQFGVTVARRGWAQKYDILNSRTHKEFEKWIKG